MTLETVLHATLDKSRKKLMFSAVKSNAYLAWSMAKKRIDFEDGGPTISNPLITGRNPNVQTYEYYDQLTIAQTNEFDTVEYGWSRVAGSVIISDQEQDEARGEAQIFKLLKNKIQVLDESMQEKFSTYCYGSGAGMDPNGLANCIPDDPTTGTLGGLSRATETQWRTSAYNFSGALNALNIEEAFDDIKMDLTLRSDKPDLILCGRNVTRSYRAAVRDKLNIPMSSGAGKAMYDLGFEISGHGKCPILYDEDCPVDKAYFINSKYLRWSIMKHVNMKVKQLTAPWTMDAVGRRVVWQGQMCLWNAFRKHGLLNNEA